MTAKIIFPNGSHELVPADEIEASSDGQVIHISLDGKVVAIVTVKNVVGVKLIP
jgi:hypothetical protein